MLIFLSAASLPGLGGVPLQELELLHSLAAPSQQSPLQLLSPALLPRFWPSVLPCRLWYLGDVSCVLRGQLDLTKEKEENKKSHSAFNTISMGPNPVFSHLKGGQGLAQFLIKLTLLWSGWHKTQRAAHFR